MLTSTWHHSVLFTFFCVHLIHETCIRCRFCGINIINLKVNLRAFIIGSYILLDTSQQHWLVNVVLYSKCILLRTEQYTRWSRFILNTPCTVIIFQLNLFLNFNVMLHFKQRDGHGICVNSSTNITTTHSRTCYKKIVLWTITKMNKLFKSHYFYK